MRLRFFVLLGISCGLAAAESTDHALSSALGQAFPSPFGSSNQPPDSKNKLLQFKLDPDKLFNGTPDKLSDLRTLPNQALLRASPQCAIPLLEAPIAKDRDFSIRVFPVGPSGKQERMAAPRMPVCGR
jgi:hypothetical protein